MFFNSESPSVNSQSSGKKSLYLNVWLEYGTPGGRLKFFGILHYVDNLQCLGFIARRIILALHIGQRTFGCVDFPQLVATVDVDLVQRAIRLPFECRDKTPQIHTQI